MTAKNENDEYEKMNNTSSSSIFLFFEEGSEGSSDSFGTPSGSLAFSKSTFDFFVLSISTVGSVGCIPSLVVVVGSLFVPSLDAVVVGGGDDEVISDSEGCGAHGPRKFSISPGS